MRTKLIRQSDLTGECWPIQVWGPERCVNCDYKGTPNCGGRRILETGVNANNKKVPLDDRSGGDISHGVGFSSD